MKTKPSILLIDDDASLRRVMEYGLKEHGYDGTVTLEVFSREREHLRTSRKLWLTWWSEY